MRWVVSLLLLAGCGSKGLLTCEPWVSSEYLHCQKGKKTIKVYKPKNYHCAKRDDMAAYMSECLAGNPVPQIDVCLIVWSEDSIVCPKSIISPIVSAKEYECTSKQTLDNVIRRCNRQ